MSRQDESTIRVRRPQGVNSLKAAGGTKSPDQCILKNFHGRIRPTLILVRAHFRRIEAIDHFVVEIKMGGFESTHHQRGVDGILRDERFRGISHLVILDRPGAAAASRAKTTKAQSRQRAAEPRRTERCRASRCLQYADESIFMDCLQAYGRDGYRDLQESMDGS